MLLRTWCLVGMFVVAVGASASAEERARAFRPVECEGTYAKHLQGISTNDRDAIYWSFTVSLVKTDLDGKVLHQVEVADHHGDLCYHDGKVYVAVNLGKFNQPAGAADSWVYVYDADTLDEVTRHETQEVVHGAGGIAYHDGKFIVVGGLPGGIDENYLYEYDESFAFKQRHVLPSGPTLLGIQTAAYAQGHWWFGCYGRPQPMLKADESFQLVGKYEFECALGITGLPDGRFLIARGPCERNVGCRGEVLLGEVDDDGGLRLLSESETESR